MGTINRKWPKAYLVGDKKWPHIPIFLIWTQSPAHGTVPENVDLRAVDMTREQAEIHLKMLKSEQACLPGRENMVSFIEERIINHCYGYRDMRLALRLNRWAPDGENDWPGRQKKVAKR